VRANWDRVRREHPRLVLGVWSTTLAAACLAVIASIWLVVDLQRGLPDTEAIQRIGEMQQSTAVFDADDQLAFTIFEEQRIPVALDHISPNLIHAILAVEDQRFYDHHGFDLARILKAALTNVRHGRVVQGGSTITQQLARQSFLTQEKTIRRKLQELILAARIEGEYSKDRILELYLNKVYFGDGLYGAEAAARGYFGRHASEVGVSEAALLAGLVKSPSTYAPTVNPTRAKARRNVVLQAMLDTGAIDPATWKTARLSDVVLHDTLRAQEPHGQYFKEQVRRELVDRFGWQRVYQGGLRVYSTIALPMQIAAEDAIAAALKSVEERRRKFKKLNQDDVLQAALIALDPQTGHVRAMVGGRDFNESRFNRAVQARRQPGSAFKPFVYATALEAGYTPVTVIDHLDDPISTVQGAWTPEDEHSSAGAMTMRTALRTSSNRAAVRMLQQVGIARTVQYAKQLGVGDVPSVPSLALGSGEVTLDSMTAAYAAFANHGLVPKPLLIRRVEDQDGRLLFENHETTTRAVSDVTAFLMSSMMADVINAGTGWNARRLGFTLPAAGKTGTTNDFNDAWFVGYTPRLAAGVWVGFDQPHTIVPNGFAADIAVPAWATFMKAATKSDKPEWLLPPPGITSATVCRISGKLATEGCQDVEVVTKDDRIEHRSMVYTEYFARGTAPTSYCDLHPTHNILTKIAAVLGAETPSPARVDQTGTPTPAATSGTTAPAGAVVTEASEIVPSPPVKKKRGFWSRVFGIGKDSGDDKPEAETKAPKKKPGG
jgi:1A family penicillin-binding protein